MKGWSIYAHSFMLVWRNLRQALQIGLVPLVLVIGIFALWFGVVAIPLMQGGGHLPWQGRETAIFSGSLFLLWLLALVLFLWIVVNWHRFVLLAEYPTGWLPPFRFGLILGYFGRLLLLALLGFLAMLPVVLVVGGVGSMTNSPIIILLFFLPAWLLLLMVFLRLSIILPAGAVGKPFTLSEAWNATRSATLGLLLGLLVVMFGVGIVISVSLEVVMLVSEVLAVILSIPLQMFFMLVNVSLLTTLYGHFVEGRPID